MKKGLLQIVVGTSMILFAVTAFAGEGCDMKKGDHHKGMSAEQMKEYKDSHAWLFSEDQQKKGEVKASEEKPKSKLIEI